MSGQQSGGMNAKEKVLIDDSCACRLIRNCAFVWESRLFREYLIITLRIKDALGLVMGFDFMLREDGIQDGIPPDNAILAQQQTVGLLVGHLFSW